MRNLSLHRGDAFVLVYDVTKSETFEEVRRIRDELHKIRQRVPIVVVANKIDLAQTERKEVTSLIVFNFVIHFCFASLFHFHSTFDRQNVFQLFAYYRTKFEPIQ